MGSAAPTPRGDPARSLLLKMRESCRKGGDAHDLACLMDEALEPLSTRAALLSGLARYLCSTLQGACPDLDRWHGE